MINQRDPTTMPVAARRAEIAEIVAKAYLRLLTKRRISERELDDSVPGEAPCVHMVNTEETHKKEQSL